MGKIQNITTIAQSVSSFFLVVYTTTSFATYPELAIKHSSKRMETFRKRNSLSLVEKVITSVNECQEGCTLGFMKELANNYRTNSNDDKKFDEATKKTIKRIIDKKHSKLHHENHPNLLMWLWTERKCKNPDLKKLVQLLCINHHEVSKTLADLIPEVL